MKIKEIRCNCCGKVLYKKLDVIISGKFSKKQFFFDSQGGSFAKEKYDFCEDCWENLMISTKKLTQSKEEMKDYRQQFYSVDHVTNKLSKPVAPPPR